MAERFWMIHMTGGGSPGFRHPTAEAAEREAERLARADPGSEFVLLEAKESFCLPLPPIQRRSIGNPVNQAMTPGRPAGPPDIDDDLPF